MGSDGPSGCRNFTGPGGLGPLEPPGPYIPGTGSSRAEKARAGCVDVSAQSLPGPAVGPSGDISREGPAARMRRKTL